MKQMIDTKVYEIKSNLTDLEDQVAPLKEYLQNHVLMLADLLSFYKKSDGSTKNRILSCILAEKIHFEKNKDAAITFTTPINVLLSAGKSLVRGKKKKRSKMTSCLV
jgi:hypothetical protein